MWIGGGHNLTCESQNGSRISQPEASTYVKNSLKPHPLLTMVTYDI